MIEPLRQYQCDALDWMSNKSRYILRLDKGLGKTRTAIEHIKRNRLRALVVCPSYLVPNWIVEIKKWYGMQPLADGTVEVVGYGIISTTNFKIQKLFDNQEILICDEAHCLRDKNSARTKRILGTLAPQIPQLGLLTASPYISHAYNLYPLFEACQPGQWGTYTEFREAYCNKKPNRFKKYHQYDYVGVREDRIPELNERSKEFMYTVKHSDVIDQLPDKQIIEVLLSGVPDSYGAIDVTGELTEELLYTDTVKTVREAVGLSKLPKVIEFMEEGLPKPIVVFGWHRSVLTQLKLKLSVAGNKVGLITGETPIGERTQIIEGYQAGEYDYLLGSIGALGTGVNLTRGHVCVTIELPYTYEELDQAENRLYRLTQTKGVQLYRLLAEDSLDEKMYQLVNRRKRETLLLRGDL